MSMQDKDRIGQSPKSAKAPGTRATEKLCDAQPSTAAPPLEYLLSESQRIARIGTWSMAIGSDLIEWTDETYRLYGVNRDTFIPTPANLVSLLHPNDRLPMQEWIRACIAGEEPADLEFRAIHPDGTLHWLSGRGLRQCALDGTPIRIVGTVQEISNRKQIENALRESNEKLEMALRSSDMGIWQVDLQKRARHFDPRTCQLLGLDPFSFGGTADEFYSVVHPDDLGMVKRALESTLTAGTTYEVEYRVVWPDKSIHFVIARGRPVCDIEGKPQWVNGLVWDVTERRLTEEALKQSEFRYRLIADSIEDVIWLLDFETKSFTYISPSVKKLLGRTPEEAMSRPMEASLTPESQKKVQELLSFYLPKFLKNPAIPFSITSEVDQLRKDGSVVQTEVTATALINKQGKVELVGVTRNIDERKRSEEENARLSAQLYQAQRMESVGRLAGGVAHDFNNMLSVILGHAELAQEQIEPTHPVFMDLQEIQKAAQRSADLTRQLLAFARRQTVTPQVLDLNATLSGMIKMLQRLIGENIKIIWKPGPSLWQIFIDPSQIDQIMANLAVNARDAIQVVGTLTIETVNTQLSEQFCAEHDGCLPGDYVRLRVSDTGTGMNEETLKNIFEPFFTTKEFGKGIGLGLSTIYGIVKQNSGCIDVHSQPGEGTVFELYLPRYEEEPEDAREESAAEPAAKNTVLLVEDELSILQLTRRMLEQLGHTVLVASAPAEALRIARQHPESIEILMTDVVMPEMNGRDLANELLFLYPQLRCIFMSGWTADIIANHGVMEPGTHFLQKPFTRKELAAILQRIEE